MIYFQDPRTNKIVGQDPETGECYELIPLVKLPSLELAKKLAERRQETTVRTPPISSETMTPKVRATGEVLESIKGRIRDGEKPGAIAEEFGVSTQTVYNIKQKMKTEI